MADIMPVEPTVLRVDDLTVRFRRRGMDVAAVNGVSFALARGETLTILGESGSGKSVSLKALMGLLPDYATIDGEVWLDGKPVLDLPPAELAKLRGGAISMIFQEPMAALDPVYTIGEQIAETIVKHEGIGHAAAMKRALDLLDHVKIPSAARRLRNFPHELSGGMRQRAMIALALACSPSLLIADEPTTALDVTTQLQILDLIRSLREQSGMAVILITHDLGVVAEAARRVLVMYAGQCVEYGDADAVFHAPQHPYTAGLLAAIPAAHRARMARLPAIRGTPPTLSGERPAGCAFRPRCDLAYDACLAMPGLEQRAGRPGHLDRCWLPQKPAFGRTAESAA